MTRRRPATATTLGTAALGLALIAGLTAPAASADPASPLAGRSVDNPLGPTTPVVSPSLSGREGRVSVFVQTSGASALDVQSTARSATAVEDRVDEIETAAAAVEDEALALDADATVLYVARYTVPGIALSLDAESIDAIAQLDDVVSITPITRQRIITPTVGDTPRNANSDALVRAFDAWSGGATGEGISIAVIDTGLDYTHADFGGPGTPEAYAAAIASTDAPDPAWFDATKYLGGYDFAGPTYDADPASPGFQPVPEPDENPIDGMAGEHGTHVSGTAAGFGVLTDGTTFRGDYADVDESSVTNFQVAPGTAPLAGLYALKVFGDTAGSTDLTGAAIDWVGEAIAGGATINVLNLSLGSDYGPADDPDNAKIAALMDHGVLPVIAAGNAGDITDIGGSPGNAARPLAVAASSSGRGFQDAVRVTAPADVAAGSPFAAQYSQNYTGTYGIEAPVVALTDQDNLEGCLAYSDADAAAVAGTIVWLEWPDENFACGSAVRFDRATEAGAVGVLLTSELTEFEGGIAGNRDIPGAQLTGPSVDALRPALEAGTLVVRLDSEEKNSLPTYDPTKIDTIASFSSRGEHGSFDDIVKPDVSAPGVSIASAGTGTGTGPGVMSGTSMAAPLTAGVAALVFETNPTWSPDRVKAQIINTATHDVLTEAGADGVAYAPARAGTGRIDALAATTNDVTVASEDSGGLVTASFGVVEVGADAYTEARTLTVTSSAPVERTYDVSYLARTTMPGVQYTVSPSTVTVAPGGTATLTVTLTIADPTALRRTLDPTMERVQGGVPRTFVSDASGVVELTPQDGSSDLRVAVFSAPKPVSSVTASGIERENPTDTTGRLVLTGRGVDQGEGPDAFRSSVIPLQLGATSDELTFPDGVASTTLRSLDVVATGASSTAPQLDDPSEGTLTFGIVTAGPWGRVQPHSYPVVIIDVDGDGEEDFYTYLSPYDVDVDLPVAITVDSATDEIVDVWPANLAFGDDDTNVFDTNVIALPVSLSALGYTADSDQTRIGYHVETYSEFAVRTQDDPENMLVDLTDTASFDVFTPDVWFGEAGDEVVVFDDAPGFIPVTVERSVAPAASLARVADAAGADDPQVLLLHLNGAVAAPLDVVDAVRPVDPTDPPTTTPPPTTEAPQTDDPDPSGTASGGAAPGGRLPTTGADGMVPVLVTALLLVTAGATTLVVRRRRQAARAEQQLEV